MEVIGSHSYRLDTPPGIHNVFHSRLLRPARSSPLPGQIIEESQPSPKLEDGAEMFDIERILGQKKAPGRGNRQRYLVKWVGYGRPTWEPESSLENTIALNNWKEQIRITGQRPLTRTKRKRSGGGG